MNEWNGKRIAMVVGLGALAVSAALAVDQGGPASTAAPTSAGAWREAGMITTSATAVSVSPTVHATASGKCVKSSPNC